MRASFEVSSHILGAWSWFAFFPVLEDFSLYALHLFEVISSVMLYPVLSPFSAGALIRAPTAVRGFTKPNCCNTTHCTDAIEWLDQTPKFRKIYLVQNCIFQMPIDAWSNGISLSGYILHYSPSFFFIVMKRADSKLYKKKVHRTLKTNSYVVRITGNYNDCIWVVLRKCAPGGGGGGGWPCFTHSLSIKSLNVDDFHVSVAINI